MGDRHVLATRTRFIALAMLQHFKQAAWLSADTLHVRKPMPETVRMPVRERARNA